ncbi:hypothetical protein BDQ94DRAFT_155027 [Aspergillus welwitschiae]|uniref:Uncharacterized protein n=1 Tax=Aspergillus welwitschiae TaxID=1341132 RepID=A0A3F3PII8_9EURO|nr:hypothetical protein BDQ94DRAFT_155027 [Aspergillus welwitschiae]RDH26751.1 hypothetical protein BDQ94DRAFT_155027 [Aspergillus welwitschiae]
MQCTGVFRDLYSPEISYHEREYDEETYWVQQLIYIAQWSDMRTSLTKKQPHYWILWVAPGSNPSMSESSSGAADPRLAPDRELFRYIKPLVSSKPSTNWGWLAETRLQSPSQWMMEVERPKLPPTTVS